MLEITSIIECLENSPRICESLIAQIPVDCLQVRRKAGKWNIHEHICHLADAEAMIFKRFAQITHQNAPTFSAYLPDKNVDTQHFARKQTVKELVAYKKRREDLLAMIVGFSKEDWLRPVLHEEYVEYSPYILLRHTLMHDFFHMYRIEELWLTRDEFLH